MTPILSPLELQNQFGLVARSGLVEIHVVAGTKNCAGLGVRGAT